MPALNNNLKINNIVLAKLNTSSTSETSQICRGDDRFLKLISSVNKYFLDINASITSKLILIKHLKWMEEEIFSEAYF